MGSPFEQFGCLDELIQVIYHKFDRFVLLSNVTDDEWTVHVGLSGEQGRWWQGSWKDTDVFKAIVRKLSIRLKLSRYGRTYSVGVKIITPVAGSFCPKTGGLHYSRQRVHKQL